MSSSEDLIVTKYKKLLIKFLEEGHDVIDDTCLEKLLTQLQSDDGKILLDIKENLEFSEKALQAYEQGKINSSLLSFALRIQSLLNKNEIYFSTTQAQDTIKNIYKCERFNTPSSVPATIQCAFIQMFSTIITHRTGLEWFIHNNNADALDCIQKIYEKSTSIYVARECQSFFAQLIIELINYFEYQQKILKFLLLPLKQQPTESQYNLSIDAIIKILELCLKNGNTKICIYLYEELKTIIEKYLNEYKNTSELIKTVKLIALLEFGCCESNIASLNKLESKIMTTIAYLIDSKNISCIHMFLLQCQNYWSILKQRISNDFNYKLENQLVYIQIMHLLPSNVRDIKKDCVQNFLNKLNEMANEDTKIQGIRLHNLINSNDDKLILICRGMNSLVQAKEYLERDTAVYIFRTLMCILVQFIQSESDIINEYQTSGFVTTVLESIIKIIDHFHFNWQDTIETTCLLSFTQELLCEPVLGHRQISQLLQIMRRAIENFMPPNLALLMNTLKGSQLENIGPQLFKCLHHVSWEVRDSSLEVITIMAQISADKFPAFQEHILDNKLCAVTIEMARGDEESFVRVSALKCLNQMIAVKFYWNNLLSKSNLSTLIVSILCTDSEGLVRTEAVLLASTMLKYNRFTDEERKIMHLAINKCLTIDLHWEVKLNSLDYWNIYIEGLLHKEGMLDGKFPQVTFSRDKKIIQLTKTEIQTRINRVLDKLSKIRCLSVLLSTSKDPDIHVAKKAVDILINLQTLLKQYDLIVVNYNQTEDSNDIDMSNGETENEIENDINSSDDIIKSIVEQDDFSLLASVYRSQMSISDDVNSLQDFNIKILSVDEFLQKISNVDYQSNVNSRSSWMTYCSEHLDSLLTDMLEAREFKHLTNDMDCY